MGIEEFNKKELQIKNLITNIRKGDTSRMDYIFSPKFINGVRSMLKVIGVEDESIIYVFGKTGSLKVGDIVGFKIEVNPIEQGEFVWDKLYIYQHKLSGVSGVYFSCRKDDKGRYRLIRTYPIQLNRKPNGFGYISNMRDEFSKQHEETTEIKSMMEEKQKQKEKGERTEKDKKSIETAVNRIRESLEDLGKENNVNTYEVYGLSNQTLNSGTRKKWGSSVGFGVKAYDKGGNEVISKESKPTHFTIQKDRLKSKDFYFAVSKELYKLIEKEGYPLKNNINKEKGIVYIKMK